MTLTNLIVTGLATWRISHMITEELGPADMFLKLRERFGVRHDYEGNVVSWPGNSVFSCVWCMSMWVAPVLAVLPRSVSYIAALSTIAIGFDTWLEQLQSRSSH